MRLKAFQKSAVLTKFTAKLFSEMLLLPFRFGMLKLRCPGNDDLCIATDGKGTDPPPASYGTWVMGPHGGHYKRNCAEPDQYGHCLQKEGSGPICHDENNLVVGCSLLK